MPLSEALHLAMSHSKILRDRLQFLSPGNALLNRPNFISNSVYDPAIQESEVLGGLGVAGSRRGVEDALSDFDAQFTTTMLWGRNETVQNNRFLSGGLIPGNTLKDETAAFTSRLEKQMATGGRFAIVHNWNYSLNNIPSRLFGSAYTGTLRTEYRHPLWAGSGTEFTRIAGPVFRLGALTGIFQGVNQGVVIARIGNDISLAEFEANVRNLLNDVESLYWDLALSYHVYNSEIVGRNSALETWRQVKGRFEADLAGRADEAQARDNYFESRARAEHALADLFETEGQLRRLIGLTVNDGRIIRSADEPSSAEYLPDWHISLAEALTRRVELRRQKWNIKSLELQLRAARSLTAPRLDFVSGYQVNAFGDKLLGQNDNDPTSAQGLSSAYETLTQGDQTGWNIGIEFSMPLGFRAAHARVRNLELRLAKARAILGTQELEISHELSHAFQQLDRWYGTAVTNFNRRQAAKDRVEAFEAEYLTGSLTTVDLLLRSQISLAQSEISYFRSLMEYNKAAAAIHYRKGTLLERNNVHLAENSWEPEAYQEALRRAWARSHAFDSKHQHTEPDAFVAEAGLISHTDLVLPAVDDEPAISAETAGAGTTGAETYELPGINLPPNPAGAVHVDPSLWNTAPLSPARRDFAPSPAGSHQ
jgi:outer membrane protein TolC